MLWGCGVNRKLKTEKENHTNRMEFEGQKK